jgi:signal transduction histidine kinase
VRAAAVQAREPRWSEGLRTSFPRPVAAAALEAGLSAAFDLPVLVGAEVVAVIECFAAEPRRTGRAIEGEMVHVAHQIGRVFERKQVERMKDEFVSVVSHELRTPLTSIQGAIGLLESGVLGSLSGEAREMARIARDGCGRLLRLVNELLDIQKLESGAPAISPARIALGPVLARAVAQSRPHAARLGVRLDLDDAAPSAVVCADCERIAQVVSNLISNALKYSPEGERVRVVATEDPTHVRVAVEDRGPGVPEDFRRRLFHKFSQADASDARQKGGTGLGLAICKAIIDKHDGIIAYEPVLGGGARFYFELPSIDPSH